MALLAGCGGGGPSDEEQARGAVVAFLDAAIAGDSRRACAMLDPKARAWLTGDGRPMLIPRGETRAQRRREIRAWREQTRTCSGSVAYVVARDPGGVARLRDEVPAARVVPLGPGPAGLSIEPEEQWFLEPRDGTWRITVANGLAALG